MNWIIIYFFKDSWKEEYCIWVHNAAYITGALYSILQTHMLSAH